VATLKKGNIAAHARASKKKVVFKKPTTKKAAPARAKTPATKTKPRFKYELQCKKTAAGIYQPLIGASSLANLTTIARQYAR
jgi:hypothetical protein